MKHWTVEAVLVFVVIGVLYIAYMSFEQNSDLKNELKERALVIDSLRTANEVLTFTQDSALRVANFDASRADSLYAIVRELPTESEIRRKYEERYKEVISIRWDSLRTATLRELSK
jgi:hypothetical protein